MAKRVFMVDDQEWTVEKLQQLLRQEGFVVDYASTLDAAISCLNENEYDAIITDHDMDGLDGTQFLSLIRGSETDDSEINAIVDEYFAEAEYRFFVEKLKGAIPILFTADQHVLVDDVFVARKNNDDSDDLRAEQEIIAYLKRVLQA